MKCDLRLKNEDVTLTNKDGKDEEYVMYEATGTERDIQTCFVTSLQNKEGKVTDIRGIKEHFIGMLLHDKETDKPVGKEFLAGIPATIRDQLYNLAQELSGMKTEAEYLAEMMKRELQKLQDKQEAEDAGEEYVDPDIAEAEKIAEEKASGKE